MTIPVPAATPSAKVEVMSTTAGSTLAAIDDASCDRLPDDAPPDDDEAPPEFCDGVLMSDDEIPGEVAPLIRTPATAPAAPPPRRRSAASRAGNRRRRGGDTGGGAWSQGGGPQGSYPQPPYAGPLGPPGPPGPPAGRRDQGSWAVPSGPRGGAAP